MATTATAASLRNGAGGGGEVADTARKSEHLAAHHCLPTSSHRERIARAMHENGVVILAGLTGSGKSMQVPQFLLEEKEEEEDDPIDGGGGGSGDPSRPPDGIWEQRRRRQLRRRRPYIMVAEPQRIAAVSLAHRVAEKRGCPPWRRGELCGVHGPQRQAGISLPVR